ncbi:MAG: prepilin peptidase [Lachnospiraceae bacterium]|nr:prepilin peptidase [Lachnospiraceae bacterium]
MASECFILYIIVFLYGIIVGSFLNVCIYRIPKEESIVTVGSHCMACGHRLKWWDLFPVFSWLFLKGRCRYCKAKISVQYPLVELANAVLYLIIFAVNGWNIESVLWCIATSALLVLSIIDYRTMMIPTGIDLVILGVGILHLILNLNNWHYYVIGFFFASLFLLLCSLLFRLLRNKNGLGMGDVELMACAGLCIGWGHALLAVVIGSVLGSIIQGIKLAVTKEGQKFAFGPYLSLGVWIAMLWGTEIYDWYVGLVLH